MKTEKSITVAMKHQIKRLENKFGDLEKRFWSEDKSKFYSGVDLRSSILGNVATVLRGGVVEMK